MTRPIGKFCARARLGAERWNRKEYAMYGDRRRLPWKTLKLATVAAVALGVAGCESAGILIDPTQDIGQKVEPADAETRERELRLAMAARGAKQYDVAYGIYIQLLRGEPDAPDLLTALADLHFEQGEHSRALAAYDRALAKGFRSQADRAKALVGRGRARLAKGLASEASDDFAQSLAANPGDAVAINGLAVAADMQGEHLAAQTLYKRALALDPGNERIRSNLGLSLALSARFDDAVAELGPLAGASAETPKARHNLAFALGLMGKEDDARRLLSSALGRDRVDGNSRFYAAVRNAVAAEAGGPAPRPAPAPVRPPETAATEPPPPAAPPAPAALEPEPPVAEAAPVPDEAPPTDLDEPTAGLDLTPQGDADPEPAHLEPASLEPTHLNDEPAEPSPAEADPNVGRDAFLEDLEMADAGAVDTVLADDATPPEPDLEMAAALMTSERGDHAPDAASPVAGSDDGREPRSIVARSDAPRPTDQKASPSPARPMTVVASRAAPVAAQSTVVVRQAASPVAVEAKAPATIRAADRSAPAATSKAPDDALAALPKDGKSDGPPPAVETW